MPTLNMSKVHNFVRVPNTNEVRLVSEDHYVRLKEGDHPPLYVQRGMVFPEEGENLDFEDIPDWFWKEAKKVSPELQKATGLKALRKQRKKLKAAQAPIAVAVPKAEEAPQHVAAAPAPAKTRTGKPWTCPQCDAELTTLQKGAHMAKHKREAEA